MHRNKRRARVVMIYSVASSARASSIGGLGAFIMIAKNFNSVGNALIKKLMAEIVLERGVDRSMRGTHQGQRSCATGSFCRAQLGDFRGTGLHGCGEHAIHLSPSGAHLRREAFA
jgi:hypothetical protein